MSWTTRITKAPNGELRLQFPEPLSHIDMDRATAKHLAALIVVAADGVRSKPLDPGPEPKKAMNDSSAPRPILSPAELEVRRRGCLLALSIRVPFGMIRPDNDEGKAFRNAAELFLMGIRPAKVKK